MACCRQCGRLSVNCPGGDCKRSRSRTRDDQEDEEAPKWAMTLLKKMDRVSGQVEDIQEKVDKAVKISTEARNEAAQNKQALEDVAQSVAELKGDVENFKGPGLEGAVRKVISEKLSSETHLKPASHNSKEPPSSSRTRVKFTPHKVFVQGFYDFDRQQGALNEADRDD